MAQNSYTYDAATLLKDAGVVGSSAAATVGGSAAVINVGQAFTEGVANIDVTAIEVDSNDELYTISIQGSAAAAFTSPANLAALSLGAAGVMPGGGSVNTVGRFALRFQNEQDGVVYPYIRLYTTVAGTIAGGGGINFSAWIGKTDSAN